MSDMPDPERGVALLEEERRGQAAAYANGVLLALTIPLFIWQRDPWTRTDLNFLTLYVLLQVFVCAAYYLLPTARLTGPVAEELKQTPPVPQLLDPSKIPRRWYRSLWIPALCNLVLTAGLVWWTGGPIDSPFTSALLLMVVTGIQLVRPRRAIIVDSRADLPSLAFGALKQYRLALLAASLIFGLLFIADGVPKLHHAQPGDAQGGEYFLLVLIALFASVLVTHAGRAGKDEVGRSALFPATEAPLAQPLDGVEPETSESDDESPDGQEDADSAG
jgi:hypothetical protein